MEAEYQENVVKPEKRKMEEIKRSKMYKNKLVTIDVR